MKKNKQAIHKVVHSEWGLYRFCTGTRATGFISFMWNHVTCKKCNKKAKRMGLNKRKADEELFTNRRQS